VLRGLLNNNLLNDEITEALIEHVRLSLNTLESNMRMIEGRDMSQHEAALFAIEDKAMDLVVLAGLAKRRKEAGL
jgi:hypothetical protein